MTSFVGLAPLYDTIVGTGMTRAFTGIGLVLMGLRFLLVIQYGIVLYFVRGFHKTLVPLVLTMAVYLAAGIAFLVTSLISRGADITGAQAATRVTWWYIIIGVEILGVVVISSIWRILSFRHTHLVERVGLLTLIVMGEGILGMTKAVAYDVLGRDVSIWTQFGLVTSAVVLIVSISILRNSQSFTDCSISTLSTSFTSTAYHTTPRTMIGAAFANRYGPYFTTSSTLPSFLLSKARRRSSSGRPAEVAVCGSWTISPPSATLGWVTPQMLLL